MRSLIFIFYILTMQSLNSQELEAFDSNASDGLGKIDRLERIEKQMETLTKKVMPLSGQSNKGTSGEGASWKSDIQKLELRLANIENEIEQLKSNEVRPMRTTIERLNLLTQNIESDVSRIRSVDLEALKEDIVKLALKIKALEDQNQAPEIGN